MEFKKDISWEDVFEGWRERESENPGWIECATKVKGWPDWESWRRFSASQMGLDKREWKVFQLTDPLNEVPEMLIGPFAGWQSRVEDKQETTFGELLEIPEQYRHFSRHKDVISIMEGLPFTTQLIGLVRKDINKVVCVDGHHRAVAMALEKKHGGGVDFGDTPVTIALAEIDDMKILDAVLERGTDRR
ncbi:hypothetical protein CVV38_03565 [Candidatus Peregrinibacteria bacterium HGW-Peregrinibacteria-1]|jgi:hypothetical protein|nr:MAG: hypothetical protein CVV38_03565 [Candidatus Peregrinibacteria bacterium HGW-Peregrinibacteria-1]